MAQFRPYTREELRQAAAGLGVAGAIAAFVLMLYLNAPEPKPLKPPPQRPAAMSRDAWDYARRRAGVARSSYYSMGANQRDTARQP